MSSSGVNQKISENEKSTPDRSKSKIFTWTDEESALILQTVLEYKSTKLSLGNDWETGKSKYEDIARLFIANYPEENCEEFPNAGGKWKFTKERVASKIR